MDITGKKLFVKALREEGVDTLFAYPGGMITDVLDELYRLGDGIRLILPRHEQALAHEAEGYARETGKPGVCLVTSGPGATNTVTAITDAFYDSVPLVVFTGQVPLGLIGNDSFQEVDIVGMVRGVTKYAVTVRDRSKLGTIIKKAFQIATSGKPGPVLIDLPKNIQLENGPSEYSTEPLDIRGYKPNTNVHIGQLKRASRLLKVAARPIILAGGGVNLAGAGPALEAFSEKSHIPIVTTVMGKGAVRTDHPYYIGNGGMHGRYAANIAVHRADLILSIGCRFNDRITGDLNEFSPKSKIIHIDIDPASISRNVVVDVPIVGDAKLALEKLNEWAEEKDTADWMKQIRKWDAEHPLTMSRNHGMTPQMIMEGINEVYKDAKTTYLTDVGQHQMFAAQYIDIDENKKFFTSGGLGTMGYGFPAAIGAKIADPDREVVCITGDGGFQMNMQELATAMIYKVPVTICLLNNRYLGMVQQMQHYFYGKRYALTCLCRDEGHMEDRRDTVATPEETYYPDFVKWAESYQAHAIRVTDESEIIPALKQARENTDAPTLIEFVYSSDQRVLPMVKGGSPMTEMILDN